ncbi:Smr/MutS family protein [Reyranella sp.]|jgi:DNA-nicking Smr family endonuclease|uniref:Smr/MutS family protein n=1 Tax=Reyranella sp. TaxID=1929291 RepID=UPI002F936997
MVKDLDLFRTAMAGTTPLKGRRGGQRMVARPRAQRPSDERPEGSSVPDKKKKRVGGSTSVPDEDFSFDRDTDRALSRGRRSPEASLDLHGMTLAAAERAVTRFLEEAAALDLRLVLIVTGKGLRQVGDRIVGGRIRAEFPGWLRRPENLVRIRGMKPAHPRHGGGGAFYVLLRRGRRQGASAG